MKKIIKISCCLVIIDQLIKLLVAKFIDVNEAVAIIDNFFYLTHLKNAGAAWNMFEGKTLSLILLGIVGISFIIFLIKDEENMSKLSAFSYTLLLGGVTGNLIDRILNKEVIDYIYFKVLDFPIFNLSDIFIVIGVIIFSYETLRSDIYEKNDSRRIDEVRQVPGSKDGTNKNKNPKTNQKREYISKQQTSKSKPQSKKR